MTAVPTPDRWFDTVDPTPNEHIIAAARAAINDGHPDILRRAATALTIRGGHGTRVAHYQTIAAALDRLRDIQRAERADTSPVAMTAPTTLFGRPWPRR